MKHEAILIKIIFLVLFVGLYFITNLRTEHSVSFKNFVQPATPSNISKDHHHNDTFLSDAQKFKTELSVENVWKRSENCLNYFQSLAGIIFPNETLENQEIKN